MHPCSLGSLKNWTCPFEREAGGRKPSETAWCGDRYGEYDNQRRGKITQHEPGEAAEQNTADHVDCHVAELRRSSYYAL